MSININNFNQLEELSRVLYVFAFEKIAKQAHEESIEPIYGQVIKILQMTYKHSTLVSKFRKNKKISLEIAQEWYQYCRALDQIKGLHDYITYTSDEYSDSQIEKINENAPY